MSSTEDIRKTINLLEFSSQQFDHVLLNERRRHRSNDLTQMLMLSAGATVLGTLIIAGVTGCGGKIMLVLMVMPVAVLLGLMLEESRDFGHAQGYNVANRIVNQLKADGNRNPTIGDYIEKIWDMVHSGKIADADLSELQKFNFAAIQDLLSNRLNELPRDIFNQVQKIIAQARKQQR